MKVALASPPYPKNIADGLYQIEKLTAEAAAKGAAIICFPETYLPGYPLSGNENEAGTPEKMEEALEKICVIAAANGIAMIIPMDWYEGNLLFNIAYVISAEGEKLGYQTKNQLDPSEDHLWVPGTQRKLFEIEGLKFGITICHEGFRYPESVRWAAMRGAQIVFHPHLTWNEDPDHKVTEWLHPQNPYYEKAMMMRALENTIYFAGVNYTVDNPASATALIGPDGTCVAYQPYGQPGVFVADIDLHSATGNLAKRFKPALVQ
ncbi:amidohydrolase [Mucilaginibacter sp. PAMC 26640]|nr:amidohydrolase [Mucilaginibacter sp. PAMC 26640]